MTELQEELARDPEDFSHETWRIDGPGSANWALRKLKQAEERLADIKSQAKNEIDLIIEWVERVEKQPQRDKVFFENQLQAYMLSLREADPETKSLDLPDGRIESRSVPAKAEISDKELLLKWLENNAPSLIRHTTKDEPDMVALKEAVIFDGDSVILEATGEIVEGAVAIEESISVKVVVSR